MVDQVKFFWEMIRASRETQRFLHYCNRFGTTKHTSLSAN